MDSIKEQLSASIPEEFVSKRKGAGNSELSYVSGRYVKQRLNEIFGWDRWGYAVVRVEVFPEKSSAFAHVRLEVITEGGAVCRDGLAYGYPAPKRVGTEEGFDFAIAEAVTDALKRAAVSLGQNMGLELYPMAPGGKPTPKRKASKLDVLKAAQKALEMSPTPAEREAVRRKIEGSSKLTKTQKEQLAQLADTLDTEGK